MAGSNASAEGADADEGADAAGSVSGIDIVLNHRLTETGFGSKKDYMVYLKDYMKKVVKYLEENERAGEVDDFKTKTAVSAGNQDALSHDLVSFVDAVDVEEAFIVFGLSIGESLDLVGHRVLDAIAHEVAARLLVDVGVVVGRESVLSVQPRLE